MTPTGVLYDQRAVRSTLSYRNHPAIHPVVRAKVPVVVITRSFLDDDTLSHCRSCNTDTCQRRNPKKQFIHSSSLRYQLDENSMPLRPRRSCMKKCLTMQIVAGRWVLERHPHPEEHRNAMRIGGSRARGGLNHRGVVVRDARRCRAPYHEEVVWNCVARRAEATLHHPSGLWDRKKRSSVLRWRERHPRASSLVSTPQSGRDEDPMRLYRTQ